MRVAVMLVLAGIMLAGCSITRVNVAACGDVKVSIEQPRTVGVTPSIKADGNDIKGLPGL